MFHFHYRSGDFRWGPAAAAIEISILLSIAPALVHTSSVVLWCMYPIETIVANIIEIVCSPWKHPVCALYLHYLQFLTSWFTLTSRFICPCSAPKSDIYNMAEMILIPLIGASSSPTGPYPTTLDWYHMLHVTWTATPNIRSVNSSGNHRTFWDKKCNLSGQTNHATSGVKIITQPLGTKKNHATSPDKKITLSIGPIAS